jgi:ABC-2 type transport system permease protein
VFGSLLAGRIFLPGNGFTVAHGFLSLSVTHGPTLRAAVGSVLYLVLVALFSLGVAVAVRDTATAIAVVLTLMYVVRAVSGLILDPTWQHRVERVAPMNAGLAIQSTTNLGKLPIGPWAGLGVLAAWTAAALLTGWLLLQLRDA